MVDTPAEPKPLENQKSCLDVLRDIHAARKSRLFLCLGRAQPLSTRITIVLTLQQSNPNFDLVEAGLQSRAKDQGTEGITGIGMFVAHFAVLFLEGEAPKVMECIQWLADLVTSQKVLDGTVLFFCDYDGVECLSLKMLGRQKASSSCSRISLFYLWPTMMSHSETSKERSYKLMPSYWSLRPKDFMDMRFEEGEEDLTEDAVAQQALGMYEKMILLAHELRATNLEAGLDPTGMLAKEFVRFVPDPRVIHSLLRAAITKTLLFSVEEFREYFIEDFFKHLPRDAGL